MNGFFYFFQFKGCTDKRVERKTISISFKKRNSFIQMQGSIIMNPFKTKAFANDLFCCDVQFGIRMHQTRQDIIAPRTQQFYPLRNQFFDTGHFKHGIYSVFHLIQNKLGGFLKILGIHWKGTKRFNQLETFLCNLQTIYLRNP